MFDDIDLEILFSDFGINATCNNKTIRIIFDENTINETFQKINVNGLEPIFSIKKCDFLNCNIDYDTEIEVDNEIYIVKDIRKSKTNIYKLRVIYKD